jgi:hypothetical protein
MIGLTDDEALRDLAKGVTYTYISEVQGDVAEFGCFHGKSARVIAQQMQMCDQVHCASDSSPVLGERKLWLFDSFQGLPKATLPPDTESPHVISGAWNWTVEGANAPTPAGITQQCSAFLPVDRIKVISGWYREVLTQIPADTKFAFVHIDCDLYESAYQVLDYLFGNDMLSDGCALFFDDWYCNRGNPRYGEQKAFYDIRIKYNPIHKRLLTDWGPYGIVGRKFIVHGT